MQPTYEELKHRVLDFLAANDLVSSLPMRN